MLTKQEKIDKIYSIIADKTVSFGCILKEHYEGKDYIHTIVELINENKYYYYVRILDGIGNFNKKKTEIIGHPVMIGNILNYIENMELKFFDNLYIRDKVLYLYKNKTNAIEKQSEVCIDYIFNLLHKK